MQFSFDLSLDLFDNLINLSEINSSLKSLSINKKIIEEFLISDFFYFSKIVDLDIDNKGLREYALGFHKIENTITNKITSSYRNTLEMIPSFYTDKENILTLNNISRINKILTEKSFESWESGKLRTKDFPYISKYDFLIEDTLYNGDIYSNLKDIFIYYKEDKTPKNLKNLVIVYNFLKLKPFCALNDITSLIILKLLFFDIDYFSYIPILKIFYENKENLDPYKIDINEWLANISSLLNVYLKDMYSYINKYTSLEKRKFLSDKIISSLNFRQKEIFFFLLEHKSISRQEYMKIYKVSSMTAFRDLSDMKKKNMVSPIGTGRGLRYTILEKYLI